MMDIDVSLAKLPPKKTIKKSEENSYRKPFCLTTSIELLIYRNEAVTQGEELNGVQFQKLGYENHVVRIFKNSTGGYEHLEDFIQVVVQKDRYVRVMAGNRLMRLCDHYQVSLPIISRKMARSKIFYSRKDTILYRKCIFGADERAGSFILLDLRLKKVGVVEKGNLSSSRICYLIQFAVVFFLLILRQINSKIVMLPVRIFSLGQIASIFVAERQREFP